MQAPLILRSALCLRLALVNYDLGLEDADFPSGHLEARCAESNKLLYRSERLASGGIEFEEFKVV